MNLTCLFPVYSKYQDKRSEIFLKNHFSIKNVAKKILWIYSPDQLDVESPEESGNSNFGEKGFLGWLLGKENLTEEPELGPPESPFGSKGFFGWLFSSESIEQEDK